MRDGSSAEIAFEVADEHQKRGIGSALTAELVADARAAGITEVTALVATENTAAVSLLRRVLGRLDVRYRGDGAVGARGARLSRPPVRRSPVPTITVGIDSLGMVAAAPCRTTAGPGRRWGGMQWPGG